MNTNLIARPLKGAGALAGLCYAFLGGPALAQPEGKPEDEPDTIATDRPDFTESALVVPHRWLQIENGFTYLGSRGVYALGGPESLFRYGVGRGWELRLAVPNYNTVRTGGMTTSGFGDTYLGAKVQLGPTKGGWDVSLIPAVFVPSGSRDFSSRSGDPEIKLCYAKDLSPRWVFSGMVYYSLPTENARRNSTLQKTFSFGYDLGGRWSMFFEYVGTFARHSYPEHLYHSGFAYLLNNDTQFDIHYGLGLNSNAPEFFIGAGLSFRFGQK
jgi:hypothetical protein